MTDETVLARLTEILIDVGVVPPHGLVEETETLDDLGVEELDLMEIVIEIERKFEVDIDDGAVDEWENVGDIVKTITEKFP